VHIRSIQAWEAGVTQPNPKGLERLLAAMVEAGGFTPGQEQAEAAEFWAAVEAESTRAHPPFDAAWFASLLTDRAEHSAASPRTAAPEPQPLSRVTQQLQDGSDWSDAPDVLDFVGRDAELATLHTWILDERCQLIGVLGMGGIGKTRVAAKLARDVAPAFDRAYWRDLRNAPPVGEWLAGAIGVLSGQHLVPPEGEAARLRLLLQLLGERPGLLVLDNFETVLQPGDSEGRYREGMAGYGAVLQAVGETNHHGCVLLTSREAPPELAVLEGRTVRSIELGGLGAVEGQVLLASKQLNGDDQEWDQLIARYGGNSLALKVVGESIRHVFGGDIGAFLGDVGAGTVFGGIRRLLAEQFERSSALEQQILRALAAAREPLTFGDLFAELGAHASRRALLEAAGALRRRSLVERAETSGAAALSLQSVVLEYITDRLIEEARDELVDGQPALLLQQPLIRAQAKDYVRQSQERLIGEPILEQMNARLGSAEAEQRLLALLRAWRGGSAADHGYGPGNVVNLLRLLRGDLRGLDMSRLVIRQAYLAMVDAQDASLAEADLVETVLAEAFDFPGSVALSADGAVLAAGTSTGKVWLWRVADRTLVAMLDGHTGAVWGVALSADGQLVASGGAEGTVRLWEASTGRSLATLPGHDGAVWATAVSADGRLVASGGQDGSVRLWDTRAPVGGPLMTLRGHTSGVRAVAMSADAELVASGGGDRTVRLWEASTGRPLATLEGHTGALWGVALSEDGGLVASGGQDATVRLWETRTGRLQGILHGHTGGVWSTTLSADGRLLASGAGDGTVRLWEAAAPSSEARPVVILHGHSGSVWGAALSADGRLLASGGGDGTVRLWEAGTGRPLATLQGHTGGVRAVALTQDGELVASGGQDGAVRLWEASTGRLLAKLPGNPLGLWGVAVSMDGTLAASGGGDGNVRLWETRTGRLLATLQGETGGIWSVALSADGQRVAGGDEQGTAWLWQSPLTTGTAAECWGGQRLNAGSTLAAPSSRARALATLEAHASAVASLVLTDDGRLLSGGADGSIRVWDIASQRALASLQGHTSAVWGLALDAARQVLVSGSEDGTVQLWDLTTNAATATLSGHTNAVYGVAVSASGELLASCGADGTVRLWVATAPSREARPLAILRGHAGVVRSVAMSPDGRLLVSGGFDETVRLWDPGQGVCLRVLRSDRRYERVDLTGLTGITSAQYQALIALGGVSGTAAHGSVS
jgi:WD40 repeat protein